MTSRGYAVALGTVAVMTLVAWARCPVRQLPPDWPVVLLLTVAISVAAGMTVSRFARRQQLLERLRNPEMEDA